MRAAPHLPTQGYIEYTDLPEKKRIPSWAGAEKFAVDLNFGEKTAFLLRLV